MTPPALVRKSRIQLCFSSPPLKSSFVQDFMVVLPFHCSSPVKGSAILHVGGAGTPLKCHFLKKVRSSFLLWLSFSFFSESDRHGLDGDNSTCEEVYPIELFGLVLPESLTSRCESGEDTDGMEGLLREGAQWKEGKSIVTGSGTLFLFHIIFPLPSPGDFM